MLIPTRSATDKDVLDPDFPEQRPHRICVSSYYRLHDYVATDTLRSRKVRGRWVVRKFCCDRYLLVRTDRTHPLPDFVVNLSEVARPQEPA